MANGNLTKFDFNALNFEQSECVSAMSAEEVGQFVLLLVKSWLLGKECSLPDDPAFLSRIARVSEVSNSVLRKFPVVETPFGPRRRNEVLFNEWVTAVERFENASERGKHAAYIKHTTSIPQVNSEYTPIQSNPSHTNPIQSKGNLGADFISGGIWKFIASRYVSYFGISPAGRKTDKEQYDKICRIYGEDKVLEIFDRWASGREDLRKNKWALQYFYKDIEAEIEGDQIRAERETQEQASQPTKLSDDDLTRIQERATLEVNAEIDRIDAQRAFYEAHKDEI